MMSHDYSDVLEGNKKKFLNKNLIIKCIANKFNRDVVELVALCKPSDILDVGCGEGFTTKEIARELENARLVAIDNSIDRINYAKERNKLENITYEKGDLFNLSFYKNSFDLVVCNELLEHLQDYKKALDALINLSKDFVLISVPNEPWFRLANLLRLHYLLRWGSTPGHVNHWTKNQIYSLLKKYGKIVKLKTSTLWNIILLKKYED